MKFEPGNSRNILVAAGLISVLMSLLCITTHPLLNNDAFSYLKAAEKFSTSGLLAVLGEYGWYGYSILIGLFDQILPGDLLASAWFLNALAYVLLTTAFILLCMELHTGPHIPLLAAITILCYPMINEMRFMLIRDFAYWGFALLSLQQLIRYCRTGSLLHAAGWCAALFAAIFFRLEGLLMLMAPCFLLWPRNPYPHSYSAVIRLIGVLFAGLLLIILLSSLVGVDLPALMRFAYRYYLMRYAELGAQLESRAFSFSAVVLVLSADMGALVVNLVNALGLPLTIFLAWGLYRHGLQGAAPARRPLQLYLLFTLTTLLLFVVIMHFMTQRYAALLCLLLLTQVPASLVELGRLAQTAGRQRQLDYAARAFACYFLIDGFVSFGYATDYIALAADWSRNELPRSANLHTNSPAVAWRSGLIADYDRIARDPALVLEAAGPGDYLVLDLHYDDDWKSRIDTLDNLVLLRTFSNTRQDEIRIYTVR